VLKRVEPYVVSRIEEVWRGQDGLELSVWDCQWMAGSRSNLMRRNEPMRTVHDTGCLRDGMCDFLWVWNYMMRSDE
jgi:hypothetical protein